MRLKWALQGGSGSSDGVKREPGAQSRLTDAWIGRRNVLFRVCLRWTRWNRHDAEDLLGDACLRVLEARPRAGEVSSVVGYSTKIIENLARDRQRSLVRTDMHLFAETEKWPSAAGVSPYAVASARETLSRTLEVLDGVPRRQRAALLLRSLGDDYARIALEVGTSKANARKLVQLARAAVQTADEGDYGGASEYSR
jgi:RNA polymerase sigma factor (sigma-70 family)